MTERCLFVFFIGLLVFNWPLLDIFQGEIVAYIYGVWLLFIATLAIALHRSNRSVKADGAVSGDSRP